MIEKSCSSILTNIFFCENKNRRLINVTRSSLRVLSKKRFKKSRCLNYVKTKIGRDKIPTDSIFYSVECFTNTICRRAFYFCNASSAFSKPTFTESKPVPPYEFLRFTAAYGVMISYKSSAKLGCIS